MGDNENYIYKKEVDWSLLHEGLTLPLDIQVVFAHNMGRFLKRGESKEITLLLEGVGYEVVVYNVNFDPKWKRKKDTFQIKYSRNSNLSQVLQTYFYRSYNYIKSIRETRPDNNRSLIKLPDDQKEYLAIYTTEVDDTFLLEAITSYELSLYEQVLKTQPKRVIEDDINYIKEDKTSTILMDKRITRIRKLNRKIGENLKLLYEYRCQICGHLVGENHGTHVIEAHHIDYFSKSFNNNADNLLILCPNHHRIIHNTDPIFNKKKLSYIYPNGYIEKLSINKHL